jgi:hypothetical protein
MDRFFLTEVDMRFLMAVVALAVLSTAAHAGPFRRPTSRPTTTCVGGACAKAAAVTTAPVRVVRRAVGR